jgi:L-threonylcarbamoyladenylate synthase
VTDPLDEAVAAALAGRLIVLPTDTVYGIGTRPDDPEATAGLFRAKGRPRDLQLPVLVATRAEAEAIGAFDERSRALAGRFWPGALTLIVGRGAASAGWELGGGSSTIALRVPHHPVALALLARTGPLAVSSANSSGEATPGSCEELQALFGEAVDVYLCQPEPPPGVASTVLDVSGPLPRVLRRGSIDVGDRVLDRAAGAD